LRNSVDYIKQLFEWTLNFYKKDGA
jgi:hypothetical protein